MKTSKVVFGLISFILVMGIVVLGSCSKERVESVEEEQLTDYEPMNDYYNTKKQDEQEFIIDTSGTQPIVGHEGTKIYPSKEVLMFANGDSVQWPYIVKLIELYPAKDMIYYQMPTVGGGVILTSHGEIKITAFKDGQELVLRPNRTWHIEMPNTSPETGMNTYYGATNGSIVDWGNTSIGTFVTTTYGYATNMKQLGWVSCAKDPSFTNGIVNYTFTSTTDNLTTVSKFIYLPDTKGLVQLYSNTAISLPDGENIKIVFLGIDGSGQLFHYFSETSVSSSSNSVSIAMTAISDADLTVLLDDL